MVRTLNYHITISDEDQNIREYLRERGYSHHILAGLKRSERGILLNGIRVPINHPLRGGDLLTVCLEETAPSEHIRPVPVSFSIVYEDEDLLVINKPADTPVHPSINNRENTLANGVAWHWRGQEPFVYRCVSRLDRDTSGLLVIAKNALSASILTKALKQETLSRQTPDQATPRLIASDPIAPCQIASCQIASCQIASCQIGPCQIAPCRETPDQQSPFLIHRTYLAIVVGRVTDAGTVDAPIARREGSVLERCVNLTAGERAVTHYRPLLYREDLDLTLLSLELETGRTHQIRVHMKHIGHPVIGDFLYNPGSSLISRQALHSWRLQFLHPITKERLSFQAPLPDDMKFIFKSPVSMHSQTASLLARLDMHERR